MPLFANLGLIPYSILLDQKLIMEVGSGSADIGRKPIMLEFNQNAGYSICIDLGVEIISIMLTDLKGEKIATKKQMFLK